MATENEGKQAWKPTDDETARQPLTIDLEGIKKLLALMEEHNLVELEMEQADMAVRLKKRGSETDAVAVPAVPTAASAQAAAPAAEAEEELIEIKSPMVGTFYSASSPDAEPFVKVGDTINEDTVVCVIEAMKVFNEIRAEVNGTITRACVSSGASVEFGQSMFLVRPASP